MSWTEPSVACNPVNLSHPRSADLLIADGIGTYPNVFIWTQHLAVGAWAYCGAGATSPTYYPIYTHEAGSACSGGKLFDACIIPDFTVAPGDVLLSSVSWSSTRPNVVHGLLFDVTAGESFSFNVHLTGFDPIDGGCGVFHFTGLPRFSSIGIHCTLTVNGQNGGVGAFASGNTFDIITDLNDRGLPLTRASPLSHHGADFTVEWLRS